jgi:hypothetical protein
MVLECHDPSDFREHDEGPVVQLMCSAEFTDLLVDVGDEGNSAS